MTYTEQKRMQAMCIQDKYDKRILSRRYGDVFDCNNCGRSWFACKDDIIFNGYNDGPDLDVKLRCPYCHNMINIPRNFSWH